MPTAADLAKRADASRRAILETLLGDPAGIAFLHELPDVLEQHVPADPKLALAWPRQIENMHEACAQIPGTTLEEALDVLWDHVRQHEELVHASLPMVALGPISRRRVEIALAVLVACRAELSRVARPIVESLALHYAEINLSREELVAAGERGTALAADRYRPAYSFASYARWWASQSIVAAIAQRASRESDARAERALTQRIVHEQQRAWS
jgi:hypothetical protein